MVVRTYTTQGLNWEKELTEVEMAARTMQSLEGVPDSAIARVTLSKGLVPTHRFQKYEGRMSITLPCTRDDLLNGTGISFAKEILEREFEEWIVGELNRFYEFANEE